MVGHHGRARDAGINARHRSLRLRPRTRRQNSSSLNNRGELSLRAQPMRSLRLTGTLQVRGSEKLQRTYVRGQGLPAQWRPVRPKGFLGSVLVRRRGPGQRRWLSGERLLGVTSRRFCLPHQRRRRQRRRRQRRRHCASAGVAVVVSTMLDKPTALSTLETPAAPRTWPPTLLTA